MNEVPTLRKARILLNEKKQVAIKQISFPVAYFDNLSKLIVDVSEKDAKLKQFAKRDVTASGMIHRILMANNRIRSIILFMRYTAV